MHDLGGARLFTSTEAEVGRDLATVLTELGGGPYGYALAGGLGLVLLAGLGVVVTSTLLRRPGAPADRAVLRPDPTRARTREGQRSGARDAESLRFRSPEEVVETLAGVALVTAALRRVPGGAVVDLSATPSSWNVTGARSPVCRWETGFLAAGLGRFARGRVRVRETACRAAGAAACRFEIEGDLAWSEAGGLRSGERLS